MRGPQTIGEIRGRTERLYAFNSLDEVQKTLSSLEDGELVKKLPRLPGRKESRYTHLLSGELDDAIVETVSQEKVETVIVRKDKNSTVDLQEQIDNLHQELQNLRLEFETFKSQFE